jgi:hypothetical protein
MLQHDDTYPMFTASIVRDDAQNQLGFFADTGNLFNFCHIVKRHEMDALQFGFGNVRGRPGLRGKSLLTLSTRRISLRLAQSKLTPRMANVWSMTGSGLHLTAGKYVSYIVS